MIFVLTKMVQIERLLILFYHWLFFNKNVTEHLQMYVEDGCFSIHLCWQDFHQDWQVDCWTCCSCSSWGRWSSSCTPGQAWFQDEVFCLCQSPSPSPDIWWLMTNIIWTCCYEPRLTGPRRPTLIWVCWMSRQCCHHWFLCCSHQLILSGIQAHWRGMQ